ncbi:hypothetical protein ACN47E_008572 [Coniothyrium glycines]
MLACGECVAFLLSLASTVHSLPSLDSYAVNLPLPSHVVDQLASKPTWLENIAVRSNGDLLVTQLAFPPVLYTVKSPWSAHAALEPIYTFDFPNITDILGITETLPDTFIVVAGNATADSLGYAGTWSAWSITFPSLGASAPGIRKITNIPAARLLNGLVALPEHPTVVLIADSQFGLLIRLDTATGKSEIIADRPEFKPHPELRNHTVGFGINGVKIRGQYLYLSNSDLVSIFRVRITSDGYIAQYGKAPVELYADLSSATIFVDDITIAEDGTLYAMSNFGNSVVAVSPDGRRIKTVVGGIGELTVAGDTSAAFGRTNKDKDVLYVCTAGALAEPVNGTVTEPGKVVAVDTSGWKC